MKIIEKCTFQHEGASGISWSFDSEIAELDTLSHPAQAF